VLVSLSVLISWYFSFLIIFILPMDISQTVYRNCQKENNQTIFVSYLIANQTSSSNFTSTSSLESITSSTTSTTVTVLSSVVSAINETVITSTAATPASNNSNTTNNTATATDNDIGELREDMCNTPESILGPYVIYDLWRIVYWSSQLLTWLILPVIQSFSQAGEFTFWGKLKTSVRDNAIYYCSYILIAIILLVYIYSRSDLHMNMNELKAVAAAASNTWGLTLLVFMLGYGLVEVPTQLWNSSKPGYRLTQSYFKVSKIWSEKSNAEGDLEDVLETVELASRQVERNSEYTQFLDVILRKVPTELLDRVKHRNAGNSMQLEITEKLLANLHRRTNFALQAHKRTQAQWEEAVDRVLDLEDQYDNMTNIDRVYRHQTQTGASKPWYKIFYTPTVEWYWRCLACPLLYKVLAFSAAFMSSMLTWSEVTFFVKSPPLSLFALFIDGASYNHNYTAIEMISFLSICYMCICAYYTIFKVRVLNFYYLASNHQSDEYTLLFSGALLCRLTPPLCLNFLSLIHMDSHVLGDSRPETAYTRVMGHMDVVSIVSDYFNIYFPILLLVLTAATYMNVGSRILSTLGFQQFLDSDEDSGEFVDEGKELIKREKRRRDRLRGRQV